MNIDLWPETESCFSELKEQAYSLAPSGWEADESNLVNIAILYFCGIIAGEEADRVLGIIDDILKKHGKIK